MTRAWWRLFAGLAICLSAANLLRPVIGLGETYHAFDLVCFWRAGGMWLAGVSPYDVAYLTAPLPTEGYVPRPFFYPPNARLLFEAIALMEFERARGVVMVVAVALWGAACALTARALPIRIPFLASFARLAVVMSVMLPQLRMATEGGQTTPLTVAGLALLLSALREPNARWSALGMVAGVGMLMLKPQLGLPICLVLTCRGERFGALAIATLLVGAAALYGMGGRPDLILPTFATNAAAYASFPENGPLMASSLATLLHLVGAPSPPGAAVVVSLAAAALIGVLRTLPTDRALLLAICSALFLTPGDSYDYLVLIPFLPALLALRGGPARLAVVSGLVLAQSALYAHAAQGAGLVASSDFGGNGFLGLTTILDALAIGALTAAVAWSVFASRRAGRAGTPSDLLVEPPDLVVA